MALLPDYPKLEIPSPELWFVCSVSMELRIRLLGNFVSSVNPPATAKLTSPFFGFAECKTSRNDNTNALLSFTECQPIKLAFVPTHHL